MRAKEVRNPSPRLLYRGTWKEDHRSSDSPAPSVASASARCHPYSIHCHRPCREPSSRFPRCSSFPCPCSRSLRRSRTLHLLRRADCWFAPVLLHSQHLPRTGSVTTRNCPSPSGRALNLQEWTHAVHVGLVSHMRDDVSEPGLFLSGRQRAASE